MIKYLLLGVIVIAGYLYLKDPAPNQVYINGIEYGPKTLDKTNDSLSKVFNYLNKSSTSNDYVSILYRDSGTSDLLSWSDSVSRYFTSQGFIFESSGANKKGVKGNFVIFIVPLYEKDVLLTYVSSDSSKALIPLDNTAFDAINKIQMK